MPIGRSNSLAAVGRVAPTVSAAPHGTIRSCRDQLLPSAGVLRHHLQDQLVFMIHESRETLNGKRKVARVHMRYPANAIFDRMARASFEQVVLQLVNVNVMVPLACVLNIRESRFIDFIATCLS